MSEQKLIDANALNVDLTYDFTGHPMNGHRKTTFANIRAEILCQPTIDPETLPIVRQLRAELERVTAERDAAVSDIENVMAYNSDICQLCKNSQCYVRGGTKPCLPKWRGAQKEE